MDNNSENIEDDLIYREYAFKSSTPPLLLVNTPINYTSYGSIAPNFTLTIINGLGKYYWYEFLETGESSDPIELKGVHNEKISDIFNQNLWNKLPNGDLTIRFYVVNSLGKVGKADVIIRIDILDTSTDILTSTRNSLLFNSTTLGFIIQIWMSFFYIFIFLRRYIKKNAEPLFLSLLLFYFLFFILLISTNINVANNLRNIQDDLIYREDNLKLSTAPTIQINSPINYTLYGSIAPNFSITIVDGLANYSWYEFLEAEKSSVPTKLNGILNENVTGPFNQSLWSNLINGTETIRFYANNSLGEVGQADVIVRIDVIDPTINVIYPIGGFFNSTAPEFTVEIEDPNLEKMWYILNTNSTKHFFETNGTIDQNAWNLLQDGIVNITFFANDSVSNIHSNITQINKDIINPTGSITINGGDAWTNSTSVILTLTYNDTISGIDQVRYSNDGISWTLWETANNTRAWTLSPVDGTKKVYYEVKDNVGLITQYNDTIGLDTMNPETPINLSATPSAWTNIDNFNLSWINPSDTSGIAGVYYNLDHIPISDTNGTYIADTNIESLTGITVGFDGIHTIYIWLVDTAGNINYTNYVWIKLFLDTMDPSAPSSLIADPTSWTNIDNFNLSWSNPSDTSGIAGVYYSLDHIPISDTNGTYIESTNISSLTGITVGSDGVHTIYIWLVDTAGNINYNNYTSVKLYLDATKPLIAIISPEEGLAFNVAPNITVSVIDPNFNSTWYCVNSTNGWSSNKTLINNQEQEFDATIWENLPKEGKFQLYVFANDSIGNINYTFIILFKDILNPRITINSPKNLTYWGTRPPINVSAYDLTFDSIWYQVGTTAPIKINNNEEILLDNGRWGNLDQGEFTISFFVYDIFNHVNDTFVLTLYKDTEPPVININSPNNLTSWNTQPTINVIIYDQQLNASWYRVYSLSTGWSSSIPLANNSDQLLNASIWNSLDQGEFQLYIYANDTVGNLNVISRTLFKDDIAPEIIINLPLPGYDQWNKAPTINAEFSDKNYDSLWYRVYSLSTGWSSSIPLANNTDQLLNVSIWNSLDQGEYQIYLYANDTVGNLNVIFRTIFKDTLAPVIIINSPQKNSYWKIAPLINVSVFDPNLGGNQILYSVDEYPGLHTLINNTEQFLEDEIWENLDQGEFHLRVSCTDRFGHINQTVITLYKDTEAPVVYINSPSDLTYWNTPPFIDIIIYDQQFNSSWYNVYSLSSGWSNNITLKNNTSQLLNSSIWNSLDQEEFQIYIYVNDSFGYLNTYILTLYKDTIAPTVLINSPNNNTYWNSAPDIQVTVSDANFDSVWYIVGETKIMLTNGVSELLDSSIWDGLSDEDLFIIYFYANDSANNENTLYNYTLYKDISEPSIIVNSPMDNSYWNSVPDIQVTVSDVNFDSVWYIVGETKIMLTNGVSELLNSSIWDGLSDEDSFVIHFYANDSAGNENDLYSYTIYKDISEPSIIVNSPMDNSYWNSVPDIQVTVLDGNFDSVWYIVGETKIMLTNGVSEPLNSSIWDGLPDEGSFVIYFYANDSAGNENALYNYIIHKDTSAPFIVINSPTNNSYWNSEPIFNIIVYDLNLDSISYKALDYYPFPLLNNTDVLFNVILWSMEISEGKFLVEILAVDSLGNKNSINLTLYKDTLDPEIIINFPQPNDLFGNTAPDFNISIIEINLDTTWYTLINENVNITFTGSIGKINQTIWDKFDNGTVTIRFYANDTAGNLAYEDRTIRKDIFAPIIIIDLDEDIYGINAPNFNISISGADIQATWYTIDNGLTNITFTGLWGKIRQSEWDEYDTYQMVTIRFYINNSLGKIGYDEIVVIKDPDEPIILVNSPLNQTTFASTPFINIIVIEPNLHSVWYRVDDELRYMTSNLSQYLDSDIWSNLPEGSFVLELFANDSVGNFNNYIQLYLSKDTIGPNITIVIPTENQKVDRNTPLFELDLFDDNGIDVSWYTIDGGNTSITFPSAIGTTTVRIKQDLWEQIWDNKTHGSIIAITFYSMDNLGNVNNKTINLIKYQPREQLKLFSNPIGFIFSIIGLGTMLSITVKLTKSRYYQRLNKKERSKLKKVLITAFFLLFVTVLFYIF